MAKKKAKAKRRKTHASAERWQDAFLLYLRKDLTYDEIAEEAGVTRAALDKRIVREKWPERRQQVLEEVQRRELDALVEEMAALRVDKVRAFAVLLEKAVAKCFDRILSGAYGPTPFDCVLMSKHLEELQQVTAATESAPSMIFESAPPAESSRKTSTQTPGSDTESGSARPRIGSPYPSGSESSS